MGIIAGRQREQNLLQRLKNSEKSEFLAVYGRRRVGKTYLIKESFNNNFSFFHTGLAPANDSISEGGATYGLQDQLKHFYRSLKQYGYSGGNTPTNWLDAFYMLEDLLKEKYSGSRMVVFIDELPWMDTPKSKLIQAIDAFWNSWCSGRNILFIVCGSAASWMLDNVINQCGGLYGRITCQIKLSPFNLAETEQYLKLLGVDLSRYDITQTYMALGGIPYYLNLWQEDLSFAQNMDSLFFQKNASLSDEFIKLFKSLFNNPDYFLKIVRFLSKKHCGYSREDIGKAIGLASGGTLTKILDALKASDFIQQYKPIGNSKREQMYRLADPFCWFYLTFIDKGEVSNEHFWESTVQSNLQNTWRGIAFEEICLLHINQIKHSLGIDGISTTEAAWIMKGSGTTSGAQVDLVISRADNIVNLCEMKFYDNEYTVKKEDDVKMRHRISALSEHLDRKQSVRTTLITTFGLNRGTYSGIFSKTIVLDDLFVN